MLSGTFEFFSVADVLGLIERAAASGALVVRGREVDATLYAVDGALCGGEIGDLSGPVDDRQGLETRLVEVLVPVLRARDAEFEFREGATPPWPAAISVPIDVVLGPAQRTAREWASIMTAIESFESSLERTGRITTDSITLSHLGFRILELVDGTSSIRELARRAGISLVVVAPEVRALVLAGAVRVVVDAERALATASADVVQDRPTLDATPEEPVDVVVDDPVPAVVPVGASAAPVEDADELARTRADLATRAGLGDPGPRPEPPEVVPEPPEAERAQIVVDRSELLRMFSGLKDE